MSGGSVPAGMMSAASSAGAGGGGMNPLMMLLAGSSMMQQHQPGPSAPMIGHPQGQPQPFSGMPSPLMPSTVTASQGLLGQPMGGGGAMTPAMLNQALGQRTGLFGGRPY